MPTIPSRELRDRTGAVLENVSRGETYVVTVHGQPVAELRRLSKQRKNAVAKADLLALLDRQRPDPTIATDIDWIGPGSTGELDDLGCNS